MMTFYRPLPRATEFSDRATSVYTGDGCHVDTFIMPHRIGVPNGQIQACLFDWNS